jgi:hypothetical protein
MEMDHRRRASPSQERGMGRLLASGAGGGMTNKHEGHTVTANALVATRADIPL